MTAMHLQSGLLHGLISDSAYRTPQAVALVQGAQTLSYAALEREVAQFAAGGPGRREIIEHSLFTPSCGCGSLSEKNAERVLELLRGFCRIIGEKG